MPRAIVALGTFVIALLNGIAAGAQTSLPRVTSLVPTGAQRGTGVDVTVEGVNIGRGTAILVEGAGVTVENVKAEPPNAAPNAIGKVTARLKVAPDAAPGLRALRVVAPLGASDAVLFAVGLYAEVTEKEPNNTPGKAQEVTLPATLSGKIDGGEDVDCFRFQAKKGQTLVFDLVASRMGSPLDSVVSVQDEAGHELALNEDFYGPDSLVIFPVPKDGVYTAIVRDLRYQGGPSHIYRLTMGEIPHALGALPLGGKPGATLSVNLDGVNLGASCIGTVTLPADAAAPAALAVSLGNHLTNPLTFAPGDLPEVTEAEPNETAPHAQPVSLPVTISGVIRSAKPGGPADADCFRFRAAQGQKIILEVVARRIGSKLDSLLRVLDTSGKTLAENDDAVGKDSRLEFTAPSAGEFVAQITDLTRHSGPEYGYRLTIAPPTADFHLTFTPERLAINQGGLVPLIVTCERLNGFNGDVALDLAGLPPGVSVVGEARIPAGRSVSALALSASADAALIASPLRITGSATLDGKPARRVASPEIRFSVASVALPGDVTLTTASNAVSVKLGQNAEVPVKIARREGFKGKVQLTVMGMPGGITPQPSEIAENASEGKMTFKAEGNAPQGVFTLLVVAQIVTEGDRRVNYCAAPITVTITP